MTCRTCRVPVLTQFASPDLVGAIVEGGLDPAGDPRWPDSGAESPAEYARWSGHLCGMACLRMTLGPGAPSLFALRDGALRYGAYTDGADSDGVIKGLVYAPFARYASEVHGLDAVVHRELSPAGILELLDEGRRVMASVHFGIRHPQQPAPGRGGHLVLLTSRTADGGGVHFHNPSGTSAATRAAGLPLPVFERFFAGRGVSLPGGARNG
ncbi:MULTISPECIES: peptidase [Streptomyces]|uniref:Peptidase n=1 Tax=Streptomyces glycanivorans TaxID=3033808 RepID=A0ABY9JM59_9ACTN|nr:MULTISPECIES: peptidase [unclassified Streptomyces]WSQ80577.1 C39 family peptidase [Streptomyces sp. NBC_01213]TXS15627.1 peptidase [Streptomyces sp. wa22]WLQ67156.1 peptidase [Streptomyces sp. Alt3]WSQ87909.1 C39 family peptidase [Streptomyces sp. NBC_01212]WSR06083.1 C39 family peptidase [Streptomyces sp. NBC_01208]